MILLLGKFPFVIDHNHLRFQLDFVRLSEQFGFHYDYISHSRLT